MSKILGPPSSYVEILDCLTQEALNEETKAPRKSNPLRPSSAGKDPRELAYEWMEYKGYAKYETEALTPEVHRTFKLGHAIERHVLYEFKDAFRRLGGDIEVRYEQQVLSMFPLSDGTIIEGSNDAAFITRSKKFGAALVDIKSKKDKFSSFYKTEWDEMDAKLASMKSVHTFGPSSYWIEDLSAFLEELNDFFFEANFKQLNLYFFDEHKFFQSRGVDHCAIIQYNKNDSRLREIRFKPSEAIFNQVKEKFLTVQSVVDATKDPTQVPRENILGSVACAFSKYRKIDWPEDDALKAYFSTLPAKSWPKDLDRLPEEVQAELIPLFEEYHALVSTPARLEKIEEKIVGCLSKHEVFKIRLNQDQIYRVKKLKSGGVGGGGRLVLRRDKL